MEKRCTGLKEDEMFEKPVIFPNTTKMDWFDRIDTLTVELTSIAMHSAHLYEK